MLLAIALFATTHVQFPRQRAQRSLFSLWSGAIDPGYKVYERRLFRKLYSIRTTLNAGRCANFFISITTFTSLLKSATPSRLLNKFSSLVASIFELLLRLSQRFRAFLHVSWNGSRSLPGTLNALSSCQALAEAETRYV